MLDIERAGEHSGNPHTGAASSQFRLAEATVARMSDLGSNDQQFVTMTHLGHLLNAGDHVLGADELQSAARHTRMMRGLRRL